MAKTSVKSTNSKQSKKLPTIAVVAIGCVGVLVLIGILFGLTGSILVSKFGQQFVTGGIKKSIENQTGLSVESGEDGEIVSVKNTEEGTEVRLGDTSIPSDFPKDFPLYGGAKPTGNIVNEQNDAEGKGFWLMMETSDAAPVVMAFYDTALKKEGWTIEEKMSSGESASYQVSKGVMEGAVIINAEEKEDSTSILITLSNNITEPEENE